MKTNSENRLKTYIVWDKSVRWFHWINVVTVLLLTAFGVVILNAKILGITGDAKVLLKELHVYIGYVFCVNLIWRFIWAFIGSRYARWHAVLPGGRGYLTALTEYTKGFFRGQAPAYLGHNPLGRLMVTVLLLALLIQALTGLVLAGTDVYKPPLGGIIAEWVTLGDPEKLAGLTPGSKEFVDEAAYQQMRSFREPVITTHYYSFYVLMVLIVLHIAAVVITEIKEKSNLVSALFCGQKTLAKTPVDKP